jgi:hypothetical protein
VPRNIYGGGWISGCGRHGDEDEGEDEEKYLLSRDTRGADDLKGVCGAHFGGLLSGSGRWEVGNGKDGEDGGDGGERAMW